MLHTGDVIHCETMNGQQIKTYRKQLGLTQAQLAALMGYSNKTYVSQIETGVRDMSEQGQRLLKAYISGYRPEDWPEEI